MKFGYWYVLLAVVACGLVSQLYAMFSICQNKKNNLIYMTIIMIMIVCSVFLYGILVDEFNESYDVILYLGIAAALIYILNIIVVGMKKIKLINQK